MRYTLLAIAAMSLLFAHPGQAEPLRSWNDRPAKAAIVSFVERTTKSTSPRFVPPAERIAVFDNDGTLWCEQPMYVQFAFVIARIKELAPLHPEWAMTEPYRSILIDKPEQALAGGAKAMVELTSATHAGMSTEEFHEVAANWLKEAKHPRFARRYTQLVYQPMLELLAYLRDNGFKNYIVSGGSVEFIRPWAETVYAIPPEQVVGSSIEESYEVRDGGPAILRLPDIAHLNDKAGKPVAIERAIGRRPIFAAGNSDGDFEMLEWTTTKASRPHFGLLVHHTDAEREYAYDRDSHAGRLDRGLDEAAKRDWIVVDVQKDWKTVFPGAP